MEVLRVGPRAALIEIDEGDATAAAALAQAARAAGIAADDIVPAARTVLFDGVDIDELRRMLPVLDPRPRDLDGEAVEIRVDYDGPDLDFVAGQWGCSPADVVARHAALTFTAAFCGFAPGFSYLSGLPGVLAVPRLASPRSRVPAGSVALADTWCAVYPHASPGGWRIIGTTDVRLWDVTSARPALLAPGTRVRFVPR
jgi:KipI family sensor histidine kinase inhibitor